MSNIGENIRNARIAAEMTQEELASKMGYKSKSTINKIELGKNDIPQSKIIQFAEVLNTTPTALMGWLDDDPEEQARREARLLKDEDAMDMMKVYMGLSEKNKKAIKQMAKALSE